MATFEYATDRVDARPGVIATYQDDKCLIPWFDGPILSHEWKEARLDKLVTEAPRPRTPSELQYSDRKLRSRN